MRFKLLCKSPVEGFTPGCKYPVKTCRAGAYVVNDKGLPVAIRSLRGLLIHEMG